MSGCGNQSKLEFEMLPNFRQNGNHHCVQTFVSFTPHNNTGASLVPQMVKNHLQCGRPGFDPWFGTIPWRRAMATHSSTLAWKIPWTEEPGGLQSMGSRSVRHDWANSLSLFTFMHWRGKWQPSPVFLPGGSQGRGCSESPHRVGHNWSDLAVAVAVAVCNKNSFHISMPYCWCQVVLIYMTIWCLKRGLRWMFSWYQDKF